MSEIIECDGKQYIVIDGHTYLYYGEGRHASVSEETIAALQEIEESGVGLEGEVQITISLPRRVWEYWAETFSGDVDAEIRNHLIQEFEQETA